MMDIRIYKINLNRDDDGVAFESLYQLERYSNSAEIKPELYDKVFEGTLDTDDLEDVFQIFNADRPEGYGGRSMSVSDVVEVVKSDVVNPGFYFCDTIGFKAIQFDPEKTKEALSKMITVVKVEPGKLARTAEIDTSLEGLQRAVGGLIETYYPFEEEVCIVCNDEGKYNGMRPCRAIYGDEHQLMDIVFGPFFICDCSGEDFGSLNPKQIAKYTEMFRQPEHFFRKNGEIIAVPYEPRPQGLDR